MPELRHSARIVYLAHPDPEAWDRALAESGKPYRFSHRSTAGRVFERAYDSFVYQPCEVRYADGTHALFPLVRNERRLAALTTYHGMPLSLEGTPIVLQGEVGAPEVEALFGALGGRGRLLISGGTGGSPPPVGHVGEGETHTLVLEPGFEALWRDSFSGKNRNSCRKAEKSGVTVSREEGEDAFLAYHALYTDASRRWGYGAPPYPVSLFRALAASGGAELWLARYEDRVVAGALLLRGSADLFYWSGAMSREHLALAPSNLVLRAVIESACERGYAYFDFGASTGLPGVQKFKESFGAQPCRFRMIDLSSRGYRSVEWMRTRLQRAGAGGRA